MGNCSSEPKQRASTKPKQEVEKPPQAVVYDPTPGKGQKDPKRVLARKNPTGPPCPGTVLTKNADGTIEIIFDDADYIPGMPSDWIVSGDDFVAAADLRDPDAPPPAAPLEKRVRELEFRDSETVPISTPEGTPLTIEAATYGGEDVTEAVRGLVAAGFGDRLLITGGIHTKIGVPKIDGPKVFRVKYSYEIFLGDAF